MPTMREAVVRPLITEKSSAAYQARKEYAFEVHPEATKRDIRAALESVRFSWRMMLWARSTQLAQM